MTAPFPARDGQNLLIHFVSFDFLLSPNDSLAAGVSTNEGTSFTFYPVFYEGAPISGAYDPSANLLGE